MKYPKKICEHCGYIAQMHFDILKEWKRTRNARCPKCHKALFREQKEEPEFSDFYKMTEYEERKLRKSIIAKENRKKLSTLDFIKKPLI